MPRFRIIVWLFVLAVSAAVLAVVFSVLKALAIVAALGLVIGIVFGLRRRRHRSATTVPITRTSSAARRRE